MARILIGNIKGPQGAQGIQGPQGPVGATGPQGPMPDLINNALATEAGVAALDAVMGKALQDQINQLNSDMSKTTVKPTSSVHNIGGVARIEKRSGIVNATIYVTTTQDIASYGAVCNIPPGYRPSGHVYCKTNNNINIAILSDGNVQVLEAVTSGTGIVCSTAYVCAD